MLPHDPRRRAGSPARRLGVLLVVAVVVAAGLVLLRVASSDQPSSDQPARPDLGSHVIVFDPSMPVGEIRARADAVAAEQVDDEMGVGRWALLFEPGTYGTDAEPLQITVGYYTEVAGLGESPEDVVINGKIEVYNRCLGDGGTSSCTALVNFWRSLSNLTIDVNGAGQDECRQSANFWAVSQAASVRRVRILSGEGQPTLSLVDTCTAGPQYASGGFIADSEVGAVVNGTQQQWLTRNSSVGGWSNAVWNQVFAGVDGAPDDSTFPDPAYTTLASTPVSREKPYLFRDEEGGLEVRVPSARRDSVGVSWDEGPTAGRTLPISDFFVARPTDSVDVINDELARGRNLLLTPGLYDVAESIAVRRPGTVVLGVGHPTLTAVEGSTPMTVADVPGVVVAGITLDAGEVESPVLLQVGAPHEQDVPRSSDPADPTTLSDVYFRVGGPHVGRVVVALQVNSDDVLIDHAWVWRADHGVEGFDPTAGVDGDDQRWRTNTGRNGVVVEGADVTATGLFVEHFQEYDTVWNGEDGTTIFYQNELPYDPPTQQDWSHDGIDGWAGYKVGDEVQTHTLVGAGVYAANLNDPGIHTASGFEVPDRPGVRVHHLRTVSLGAGTIDHVVNGDGDAADPTRAGLPVYLNDRPPP